MSEKGPRCNRLNLTLMADGATGVTFCPFDRLNVTCVAPASTDVTFCRPTSLSPMMQPAHVTARGRRATACEACPVAA